MLKNIIKNWRTSLLGTGSLSAAIINFTQNPNDYKTSIGMATVGILGLVVADGHKPPGDAPLKG